MDLAAAALAIALIDPGQVAGRRAALVSVSVEATAGTSTIVMRFDGPAPEPSVGVLETPPRIFFDFPGATTATRGSGGVNAPFIRRVRAAVHQPDPPVMRVVIDLTELAGYRVDAARLGSGELSVVVGGTMPVPVPTAPSEPRSAPQAGASLKRARAAEATALERLQRLGALLTAIDARWEVPDENLRQAIEEFNAVRQTLAVVEPPAPLSSAHSNLMIVCVLGATAASARLEAQRHSDPERAWNAASAAAGARILLDRAAGALKPGAPEM